jgi:alkylated DNA repair protein (DNA oxidative demethylase)
LEPFTEIENGLRIYPGFLSREAQETLLASLRRAIAEAPLFAPVMPRTGRPFSVKMTNLGSLGWVSDQSGYRYQPHHPLTAKPWPSIAPAILAIWRKLSQYPHDPEACLVNYYSGKARLGVHQDRDEEDFSAPVVSVSLGDTAVFRVGTSARQGPSCTVKLASGDIVVMGGKARLCYHGIDRILAGTSSLLKEGGRINLTLRRVTRPHTAP